MFSYHIFIEGVKYNIRPTNTEKLQVQAKTEPGERFYREKLQGTPRIGGQGRMSDYEIMATLENSNKRCSEITFQIENDCDASIEWKGIFTCNDCVWDHVNCIVEIKNIEPDDVYRELLSNWEQEFNILQISPAAPVSVDNTGRVPDLTNVEWSLATTPPGSGWVFVTQFFLTDVIVVWARNSVTLGDPGFDGYQIEVEVNEAGPAPGPGWTLEHTETINVTLYYLYFHDLSVSKTYTRGRDFLTVLSYLLQNTATGITPAVNSDLSTFFSAAINPVTFQDPNPLTDLRVFQKSDVLTPDSSSPATKGEISLKDFLADIKEFFNLYWFIDETTGKFRIEHNSYSPTPSTGDQFDDSFDESFFGVEGFPVGSTKTIEPKKYEYIKHEIPRQEQWEVLESVGSDFIGLPIRYTTACVTTDKYDVKTIRNFTTDLEAILFSDEDFVKDGFFLMATDGALILNGSGAITGNWIINAQLSVANILDAYHRHYRPFKTGVLNGALTEFYSTIPVKLQKGIKAPMCCGMVINYYDPFPTSLGPYGRLESVTKHLKNATIEIDVLHPITDGLPDYNPEPQYNESFDESFG